MKNLEKEIVDISELELERKEISSNAEKCDSASNNFYNDVENSFEDEDSSLIKDETNVPRRENFEEKNSNIARYTETNILTKFLSSAQNSLGYGLEKTKKKNKNESKFNTAYDILDNQSFIAPKIYNATKTNKKDSILQDDIIHLKRY